MRRESSSHLLLTLSLKQAAPLLCVPAFWGPQRPVGPPPSRKSLADWALESSASGMGAWSEGL